MINLIRIFLMIVLMLLNSMNIIFATPQEISAEGEYHLGDRDTREIAKSAALADAKRKIAEQAGVYVESYVEVNNYRLSKSQIKTAVNAVIKVKSERIEFCENGTLCKAYVVAIVDPTKIDIPKSNQRDDDNSFERTDKPSNKKKPKSSKDNNINNAKPSTDISRNTSSTSSNFNDIEDSLTDLITNLSKATAFTAASEYKLQEATGMTSFGNYNEKGSIANSLQKKSDMYQNYRFAELDSFVNEAGPAKIMQILNDKHMQRDENVKKRLSWAKVDRARANYYKGLVLKQAPVLSKQISSLIATAGGSKQNKLQTMKTKIDDALKLAKALDLRNKLIDNVVKKYEKANKIVAPKSIL